MRKITSMLIALYMMAISCVAFAATDISSGVLRAEGIGEIANVNAPAGYRAATVAAYRDLLEMTEEIQITGETTVGNFMLENDTVKTRVQGVLKGMHLVDRFRDAQGYYHVVVELPIYGNDGLASAVVPYAAHNAVQMPLPEPAAFLPAVTANTVATTTPAVQQPSDTVETTTTTTVTTTTITTMSMPAVKGDYTGLVVDCTGLGLKTAMAPGIYAVNKQVVYGLEHFSNEQVISRGYVGYAKDMAGTASRAGSNPLVVKAQSLADSDIRPVISNEDAMVILSENKATGFLNNGNVVFIR